MPIEESFNFLAEDDIRIKGTRIRIETVLTVPKAQHHLHPKMNRNKAR